MRTALFFTFLFLGMLLAAAVAAADEFSGFDYRFDVETPGVWVVTNQSYDNGWCRIEGYKMNQEEIRLGAFEDYQDGNTWILGPQTLFPELVKDFEAATECFHYIDEATPVGRLYYFMLRFYP